MGKFISWLRRATLCHPCGQHSRHYRSAGQLSVTPVSNTHVTTTQQGNSLPPLCPTLTSLPLTKATLCHPCVQHSRHYRSPRQLSVTPVSNNVVHQTTSSKSLSLGVSLSLPCSLSSTNGGLRAYCQFMCARNIRTLCSCLQFARLSRVCPGSVLPMSSLRPYSLRQLVSCSVKMIDIKITCNILSNKVSSKILFCLYSINSNWYLQGIHMLFMIIVNFITWYYILTSYTHIYIYMYQPVYVRHIRSSLNITVKVIIYFLGRKWRKWY